MNEQNPFELLERVFHEPNRLAILSILSASAHAVKFTELKSMLDLTDGNLSRHIKTLEEAGAVSIQKQFVDSKPCTTIALSAQGREQFGQYLSSLERALKIASKSLKQKQSSQNLQLVWDKLTQTRPA